MVVSYHSLVCVALVFERSVILSNICDIIKLNNKISRNFKQFNLDYTKLRHESWLINVSRCFGSHL